MGALSPGVSGPDGRFPRPSMDAYRVLSRRLGFSCLCKSPGDCTLHVRQRLCIWVGVEKLLSEDVLLQNRTEDSLEIEDNAPPFFSCVGRRHPPTRLSLRTCAICLATRAASPTTRVCTRLGTCLSSLCLFVQTFAYFQSRSDLHFCRMHWTRYM